MSGFLDESMKYRVISNMREHQLRREQRQLMHKVAPFLKGKTKTIRGYAYTADIKTKDGNRFAILQDRAYQIIGGTWYRCKLQYRYTKDPKTGKLTPSKDIDIIPRFA